MTQRFFLLLPSRRGLWPLIWLILAVLLAPELGAQDLRGALGETLQVLDDVSVFAVVTHKAGLAAGLAHNHLVTARGYEVSLTLSADAPETAAFEIEVDVTDLSVDEPSLQAAWYPRLELAGILDEPFEEISEKNRGKIRRSMLGAKQLDAASHPRIRARLANLEPHDEKLGALETSWRGTLALEVHGRTVEKPVLASIRWEEGVAHLEAVAAFSFSDFGIQPFSAMLGAVKNRDEFHVYVNFKASP